MNPLTVAVAAGIRRLSSRLTLAGVLTVLLCGVLALGGRRTAPTALAQTGDFAGFVDIGNERHLYLECHGSGSPTVVLEAGSRASARYWTDDLAHPATPRTMVMPGVAAFTHVCAYDRPGTVATVGDVDTFSRSDPVAQPRTAASMVADLHALLQAAAVPGPYVLAGHSLGGILVRLYASTYPSEVVGMVLVDPFSEFIEPNLTPEQWQDLVALNQAGGSDTVIPLPNGQDLETTFYTASPAEMRQAAAASPLRPMPLTAILHGKPFDITEAQLGYPPAIAEASFYAATLQQSQLVPNGRFFIAQQSGHDVHQDQPALVIEAIRQVVAGVRDPETWYQLAACCAP